MFQGNVKTIDSNNAAQDKTNKGGNLEMKNVNGNTITNNMKVEGKNMKFNKEKFIEEIESRIAADSKKKVMTKALIEVSTDYLVENLNSKEESNDIYYSIIDMVKRAEKKDMVSFSKMLGAKMDINLKVVINKLIQYSLEADDYKYDFAEYLNEYLRGQFDIYMGCEAKTIPEWQAKRDFHSYAMDELYYQVGVTLHHLKNCDYKALEGTRFEEYIHDICEFEKLEQYPNLIWYLCYINMLYSENEMYYFSKIMEMCRENYLDVEDAMYDYDEFIESEESEAV